jgi:hypothetical protein
VFFRGGPALPECGVFPCHVASFGLPIRWGQARSSARLGDVAWVRCLHAAGEGTPDLEYRQRWTSLVDWGGVMLIIALILVGLASIPRCDTR